jgi:hypothetical protein
MKRRKRRNTSEWNRKETKLALRNECENNVKRKNDYLLAKQQRYKARFSSE